MLIGLRIISILFDLFLASVLFYRPISKSKHSKETLLVLCCCFLFHVALVFLFLEGRVFVSNLFLSIVESSLVGLYFGYSFHDSFLDVLTNKPDIISRSCPQSSLSNYFFHCQKYRKFRND